jgi:hypothetical protein
MTRHALAAVTATLATTLVAATPAQATIIDRFDVTGTDSTVVALCGLTVRIDSTDSVSGRVREGKRSDTTAFFEQFTSRSLDVYTNLANNSFFTIEAHALSNETNATLVTGSVFEFTTVVAGQPFVVRDSSGTVVLRDRGAIRTHLLFDTGGDTVPGGMTLAILDIDISGPHPSTELNEESTCAGIHQLIG